MNKTVIVIAGPTASGKTAYALQLAKQHNTEIISADSRQCFRELNIGVAKPTTDELNSVTHHFINSHSIHDTVTAATFESVAITAAEKTFRENSVAVMAGGTGLYIKAFCEGLDEMPVIPTSIRQDIANNYEQHGLSWLQNEVRTKDPLYYQNGEVLNPQRLMRVLEVMLTSGRSIREWQLQRTVKREFDVVKFGIEVAKDVLYNNINRRVDMMMENGLLKEVESLLPFQKLNALQTVGYSELFEHLNGKLSLDEAIERIKINTRHYAKRQMTWFKKDPQIRWIKP